MNKVFFSLAIHNHQPVGNFDYIIEEAYSKAYLPFLSILERHPGIKVVLHYCGVLYRFFEKRHPEFFDLISYLVKRNQIEILTGGFYEPILPGIPEVDGIGQVRKMTDFIRDHFDYDPKGIWIAERVWEPQLPGLLNKAGVYYTTLDDFHFKLSGLRDKDLRGYYTTDNGEMTIGVFPGNERLRYLIPFHLPEETIGFLSARASDPDIGSGNIGITMADDGEKFGVWPETYRSVYEEGWLERFFGMLEANKEWIETMTFSDCWEKNLPVGRVYLPTTSYREMGEWALSPEAIREYEEVFGSLENLVGVEKARTLLRGGFWRNFFSKYPESNNLQKKMVYVSKKVHKAKLETRNSKLETQMFDELWQGQCNDGYWHGIFGGLYLPHLRSSSYEHLIKAEVMADSLMHKGKDWLDVKEWDIDLDTRSEILIDTPLMNLYIDPDEGGSLFEWDYRPKAVNLMNTLTRRDEGYHRKIQQAQKNSTGLKTIHGRMMSKEEGLEQFLHYDRYRRVSLLDHFLLPDTSFINFKDGEYEEEGDFIGFPYSSVIRRKGRSLMVSLARRDRVNRNILNLNKTLIIKYDKPVIDIEYNLSAEGVIHSVFGVEFNLSLSGRGPGRYLRLSGSEPAERDLLQHGDFYGIKDVHMVDEWLGISITLRTEPDMDLWYFPLETVSQSEGGFERVYQHSVFFPHWKLDIDPEVNSEWKGKFILSVEELNQ
ncbi:MAG: alpha-amylase/4-alpha-glucanotransferase domain-containing protein [Nitrospirota bacterium]